MTGLSPELMTALAVAEGALREAGVVELSFINDDGIYDVEGHVTLTTLNEEADEDTPITEGTIEHSTQRTLAIALMRLIEEGEAE